MKYSRSTILACLSLFAVNTDLAVLADETMDEFLEFKEFKEAKVHAEGYGRYNTMGDVDAEGLGRANTFGDASFETKSRGQVTMYGAATDKFGRSVVQARNKSSAINQGIGTLKESIDDVQNALSAPRKVKSNAEELYDSLYSLEQILKVVGYIPGAKAIVTPVNAGVKRLKKPVNKAKTLAAKLDKKTKPFVNKTYKVESKVNTLRTQILKVILSENTLLQRVQHSERTYPQLGAVRDAVTGTMNPVVDAFNDVQGSIHGVVKSTESESESLRSALSALSGLADDIQEVTDLLGPVKEPLLTLKRALDQEVCLDFWPFGRQCVSVSDVLNNPVLSAFNYLVDLVLDPILGSISIPGIPDGIPGLDKLDNLERVIANVERSFDNSINYFSNTAGEVLAYDGKFEGFARDIANVRP